MADKILISDSRVLTVDQSKLQLLAVDQNKLQLLSVGQDKIQLLAVGQQGPSGAVGPPGPAGAASVEFNFAFGDATPATVVTALAGKLVYGVQLHIKVPFDGTGASLAVGDAAQVDRLMTTSENDVTSVGGNTTAPAYAYAVDTPILLSITPGAGATQGSGVLVLSIQQ